MWHKRDMRNLRKSQLTMLKIDDGDLLREAGLLHAQAGVLLHQGCAHVANTVLQVPVLLLTSNRMSRMWMEVVVANTT